ncbi:MAG: glycosyltransferase family 4 protein [Gammaproteobacteria bacterium]
MKILWLSHLVPYPPTGLGVLQRSYNLIRELALWHEVHVLGFVQRQLFEDIGINATAGTRAGSTELLGFCKEVEFLPISSDRNRLGKLTLAAKSLFTRDPYSINWLKSHQMLRTALDWRDRGRFDLVHFDTISLAPYHGIFADHATTLDHHNIESHMLLRRAALEANLVKRAYFWQEGERLARYEARMCPKFDLQITCSRLDSERLLARIPGLEVSEIPNGVDVAYFRPDGREPSPRSVVFAGNLSWYPNASAMLFFAERVWPLLRAVVPDVTMHVVGAKPPATLTDLAEANPNFRVHGFVPDVRPYLNDASVYVCPIMDGGGTKLKVLDALATGKALVAHPVACEGIDVTDGKTVLFARTAEEFVQHISGLFANRERARAMGAAARELAISGYSYGSIGMRLGQVMEQCHDVWSRRLHGKSTSLAKTG